MDEYIQQLLNDAGVPESTDSGVLDQLKADLIARSNEFVNRQLIDALSDEDAVAFDKLLDEKPDDIMAIQQFITDHIPNKDQVVGAALLEFRALYLGTAA